MTLLVETITLPENGKIEIKVEFSADIHTSLVEARRLVSRYVTRHIADLLHGETPTLVWRGDGAFWRVPIALSAPSKGRIGKVGQIDVNVQTGKLEISAELIEQIEEEAERLAINAAL